MANSYPLAGKTGGRFSIAAADSSSTIVVGSGSRRSASTLAIHIIVASGTLSIAVKARSNDDNAVKGVDDVAFSAIPYKKLHLNAAVGDNSYVSTAITGTSIIHVPCSGLEVALDLTQTSGVATVYVKPLDDTAN